MLIGEERVLGIRLNRTSVGLKPRVIPHLLSRIRGLNRTSVGLKQFGFQGFYTQTFGLNRTSVGLKLGFERYGLCRIEEPQSNQRGIETLRCLRNSSSLRTPQSNQRGIETGSCFGPSSESYAPQSNQRGIETADNT